jgi:hypothetical protein
MKAFYPMVGSWKVTVKEVVHKGDTLKLNGIAMSILRRDPDRVKKDSASIDIKFTWESQLTRDHLDLESIGVWYSVDNDKYYVSLSGYWNSGFISSYGYSPEFRDNQKSLVYIRPEKEENASKRQSKQIESSQWKIDPNKIVITHHENRLEPIKTVTRIITLERMN